MIVEFLKKTPSPHNPKKFWSAGDRRVIDKDLAEKWFKTGHAKEVKYLFEEDEPKIKKLKKKDHAN